LYTSLEIKSPASNGAGLPDGRQGGKMRNFIRSVIARLKLMLSEELESMDRYYKQWA
jgi:hypothetical protein